eukprot:s516_g14.t3
MAILNSYVTNYQTVPAAIRASSAMDEAAAVLKASDDEARRICHEIRRIGGADRVTFGELVKDEIVEQTFEALMGTLTLWQQKAARKKGFITFEGELLLMGKHDATVISVTPEGASAEPAPAVASGGYVEAPAEALAVRKASKSSNRSDDSSKFHVDTSYINHRTGEVDRLEGRKSVLAGKVDGPAVAHSASVKHEDGKWKVLVLHGRIHELIFISNRFATCHMMLQKGKEDKTDDAEFADPSEKKFSHQELKVSSAKPPDVDPAKREQYLSASEFASIFGMSLAEFQKLPKWNLELSWSRFNCSSIEITRTYGVNDFREDLKRMMTEVTKGEGKGMAFLFSDTQIETFLEDINNILNTGEVPNLFAPDEVEQVIGLTRPLAKAAGKVDARDIIWQHFVQLHRAPAKRLGSQHLAGLPAGAMEEIADLCAGPGGLPAAVPLIRKFADQCPEAAAALLERLKERSVQVQTVHCNSVLGALKRAGHWQHAFWIFQQLPQLQLHPDEVSFNTLLSACSSAGRWDVALRLFSSMRRKMVEADRISYNAAIDACAKAMQWQRALQFFHRMEGQLILPNAVTFTSVLSACDKGAQWPKAMALLSDVGRFEPPMSLDVALYNSIFNILGKMSQWQDCLAGLQEMPLLRLRPNQISYVAVMTACSRGSHWAQACDLLKMMAAHSTPNIISRNAALNALSSANLWQRCLEMMFSEISWDSVSYCTTIGACGNAGNWQVVLLLLEQMQRGRAHRPYLDRTVLDASITACGKAEQWQVALHLLRQMPQWTISPDEVSCNAAISACENGPWQHALEVAAEMWGATGSRSATGDMCTRTMKKTNQENSRNEITSTTTSTLPEITLGALSAAMRWAPTLGKEMAFEVLRDIQSFWTADTPARSENFREAARPGETPSSIAGFSVLRASPGVWSISQWASSSSQWALPDFSRDCQIAVGTAGLQSRLPDRSGHCRTSVATARSQSALPDFNRDCQKAVGTAGLQPRLPDCSGHCRTSVASPRSQWALPDLNREPQIAVGTAGLQPGLPDRSGHCRTATCIHARKNAR